MPLHDFCGVCEARYRYITYAHAAKFVYSSNIIIIMYIEWLRNEEIIVVICVL